MPACAVETKDNTQTLSRHKVSQPSKVCLCRSVLSHYSHLWPHLNRSKPDHTSPRKVVDFAAASSVCCLRVSVQPSHRRGSTRKHSVHACHLYPRGRRPRAACAPIEGTDDMAMENPFWPDPAVHGSLLKCKQSKYRFAEPSGALSARILRPCWALTQFGNRSTAHP